MEWTWLRQQVETFSALLALCEENPPVTGGFSPTKASDAELWFFIYAWTNGWEINRDAGDLGRHRAHYDVTVMRYCHVNIDINESNESTLMMLTPNYLKIYIYISTMAAGVLAVCGAILTEVMVLDLWTMEYFNELCHLSVGKWQKIQYQFMFH